MNATFTRTGKIRSYSITEGKVYEVHVGGEFWGWVAGEGRSYSAMPKDAYEWKQGRTRRTKLQAVEAAMANVVAEKVAADWRSRQVPTDVKVVRLTADNIDTEGPQLAGWLLDGGEDLGELVNARMTHDGFGNAMIVGSRSRDVLGLPCTVTAYKL
jgi:hypothetical protein